MTTLSRFLRALAQHLPRHATRTYRAGRDTITEVCAYGWEMVITRERGAWRLAWADARRSDTHIIARIPLEMWHQGARRHVFFWGTE